MFGTFLLALGLLVIKGFAWRLTGSQALFSDALESVVNVLTGAFGLFSVWLATRPPDESHPYGHGRVEFFAAGLQGAMILVAAVAILREAIPSLFVPPQLRALNLGLLLSVISALANGAAGWFLIRRGRRMRSLTMSGEGRHLLADTITTVGVIGGLLAVRVTGVARLDPIAAILVALLVARSGLGLLRESADRLMDRADPTLLQEIASALASERRPGWVEVHQLRAWSGGERVNIDLHLTLPRYWELERTHDEQRRLREQLRERLARPLELLVHVDPCRPTQCALCRVEDCPVRAASFESEPLWDVTILTAGPKGRAAEPVSRW